MDDTVFGGRVRGGDAIEKLQFQRERGGMSIYEGHTRRGKIKEGPSTIFLLQQKELLLYLSLSLSPPL